MATTFDCLLHPIDCARAASDGTVSAASLREGSRRSAALTADGASIEGGSVVDRAGNAIVDIENAATAPLGQIASTSMWITIGIVVASIVFLIVFGYIVLKVI